MKTSRLAPPRSTELYTCRDGREIYISDMSDSHLVNAIRFWERNLCKMLSGGWGSGDSDDMWYEDEEAQHPQYVDLLEEFFYRQTQGK